jgi:hypothetical protein
MRKCADRDRVYGVRERTLFCVRFAAGQFAADREPTSPCRARERHGNALFLGVGQGKELARERVEADLQLGRDGVARDAKEAALAAGAVDGGGARGDRPVAIAGNCVRAHEGRNVNERQGAHVVCELPCRFGPAGARRAASVQPCGWTRPASQLMSV